MKKIILFCMMIIILVSTIGCKKEDTTHSVSDSNVTEEEYNLEVAEGNIYGTLALPKEGVGSTVAIIIPGSGPTDRDGNNPIGGKNNSLKMISDALGKEGISSLRYDKRGIGESKLFKKTYRYKLYSRI